MSHDIRQFFGAGVTSKANPFDSKIAKAFAPKTPEKKKKASPSTANGRSPERKKRKEAELVPTPTVSKKPEPVAAKAVSKKPELVAKSAVSKKPGLVEKPTILKKTAFGKTKRMRVSSSSDKEPEVTLESLTYKCVTKKTVDIPVHKDSSVDLVKKQPAKLRDKEPEAAVEILTYNGVTKQVMDFPVHKDFVAALAKAGEDSSQNQPKKPPAVAPTAPSASVLVVSSPAVSRAVIPAPSVAYVPWVDKYKPTSLKQIVGQQGEKSCMKKLLDWLRSWSDWHITGKKTKRFSKGAGDDGSVHKAVLLSGPPGIGKTTTALVVCKELGLNCMELNASDARNKKSLEQTVSECLSSHSMVEYGKGSPGIPSKKEIKNVLIMDEVDGMSGNEDRAGVAELIALIKSTRIPIICICNDRYNSKIRSLANYCYDLRFHRPQLPQIRGAVMSVLFKEGIKWPATIVDQIIEGCGRDIRQILNRLNFLAASGKTTNLEDAKRAVLKKDSGKKDENVNVFDAVRKLFSAAEENQMSIGEMTELFFSDYDLVPLFVEENYLHVEPAKVRTKIECLEAISQTADLLSFGDTIDRQIRSDQNWSLLSQKAMFSTVLPCSLMKGRMHGMINFPSWFGKFSKWNKMRRQAQQLHLHTACKASASDSTWAMDYAPALRQRTTEPLLRPTATSDGGVNSVLNTLDSYDLTLEDRETILEFTRWPDMPDSTSEIQSKVKAALTRAYNKHAHKLPYATAATGSKKKGKRVEENEDNEGDLAEEEDAGVEEFPEFL